MTYLKCENRFTSKVHSCFTILLSGCKTTIMFNNVHLIKIIELTDFNVFIIIATQPKSTQLMNIV